MHDARGDYLELLTQPLIAHVQRAGSRPGLRSRGAQLHVSRAAARAAIFDFLIWDNAEQLHSSLGYVSPAQYEQHLCAPPARAA